MQIRSMIKEDTTKFVDLMEHLGYPSTTVKIQERLNKILSLSNYKTFVAEMDGKLVGFVGMCKTDSV